MADDSGVLSAPLIIEYPFSRTTGPVIGAFLTGLREQVLLGIKGSDGRVLVPPTEYDPLTGEDLTELVEVGPGGTVLTWAWAREPRPKQPLERPFAWALVQPDGADVGFLQADRRRLPGRHVHRDARATALGRRARGLHPRPRLLGARCLMTDVTLPEKLRDVEPVRSVRTPASMEYVYTAGVATTRFLQGIAEGKILGERAPGGKVYVPSRGADPELGQPTSEQVELSHTGTLTSFCVVNVAFYGQEMEIPYTAGLILLDGADLPMMCLLQEVDVKDVRIGMRLEAVWVDEADLRPNLESIKYFRPIDEPDVEVRQPGEGVTW